MGRKRKLVLQVLLVNLTSVLLLAQVRYPKKFITNFIDMDTVVLSGLLCFQKETQTNLTLFILDSSISSKLFFLEVE
jgi:hypothetical protein